MVWEIRRMTMLKSIIKDRAEKRQQLPSKCVLQAKQDGVCVGKGERTGAEQKAFPRLDPDRLKVADTDLQGTQQMAPS